MIILFGFICFGIFAVTSQLNILQILLSLLLMIISSIIFFSFSLISMTISFYLMDGENISNGIYQLFLTPTLYHGGAFTGVLRIIFVFIIPSLLSGAIPVELVKNMSLLNFVVIICLTIFWLILSILFFNKSLKKYESNNFFGFSG